MTMESILSPQTWDFPIPIHYGPGMRRQLPQLSTAVSVKAPLLVTDRGTAALPFIAEIVDLLTEKGLSVTLFSEVSSNPTEANIADGIAAFEASDSDGVIAVGGGSAMDAGKAISFVASAGAQRIWEFDFCSPNQPDTSKLELYPVICVPTTAGTGAETDSGAIITDTVAAMKRCIFHAEHKPAMAVLDPELTLGLPANLTAWTGADALVHAIEAFVVPQFHPLCDAIALQSMRLVAGSLLQAVDHGDDLQARANMLTGSCLGGIAFAKGLGLVHSVSHMIGGVYDTHHGLTNAVMLPRVLTFNRPFIEGKVPAMCQALGLRSESFDDFYGAIVELLDNIEIPASLRDLGVEESAVDDIAAKTMTDLCLPTNPAPVELADVETLLYAALEKAR